MNVKRDLILMGIAMLMLAYTITMDPNIISNPVSETYEIRGIHTGFINGESVILVEYYDGDMIKTVDNRDMNYVDPLRRNTIDIIRTNANTSTLYKFYESERPPYGRYTVFISNNTEIHGISSNTPHAGRQDEITSLN